jgi:uncharacterized cupin superfamily protein
MERQSLFSDLWDGENEEFGKRERVFWRPDDARMGATLYELVPGATYGRLHMHFGWEEMFFVLSGRPTFRSQHGEEVLAPGEFVFCPEGRAGLHTFSNPTDESAQILRSSRAAAPATALRRRGSRSHPENDIVVTRANRRGGTGAPARSCGAVRGGS